MGIPAKWIAHIEQWQSSGLDQSAYCQQANIKFSTFSARLSDFRKAQSTITPTLIPVQIKDAPKSSTSIEATPNYVSTILLQHRCGHQLTLPSSISATWVAELLTCLD
jgi:hypothetical protein